MQQQQQLSLCESRNRDKDDHDEEWRDEGGHGPAGLVVSQQGQVPLQINDCQLRTGLADPWMRQRLVHRVANLRIDHQQLGDQVLGLCVIGSEQAAHRSSMYPTCRDLRPVLGMELKVCGADLATNLNVAVVRLVERSVSPEEDVDDHTHRPHIHRWTVRSLREDLR